MVIVSGRLHLLVLQVAVEGGMQSCDISISKKVDFSVYSNLLVFFKSDAVESFSNEPFS